MTKNEKIKNLLTQTQNLAILHLKVPSEVAGVRYMLNLSSFTLKEMQNNKSTRKDTAVIKTVENLLQEIEKRLKYAEQLLT